MQLAMFVFLINTHTSGCWQHGYLSISKFRQWIELCYFFAQLDDLGNRQLVQDWGLYSISESGPAGESRLANQQEIVGEGLMPTGAFVILRRRNLEVLYCYETEHRYWPRTTSFNSSPTQRRSTRFPGRVRERDRSCCVTGASPEDYGSWSRFEVAHIFPRSQLDRVS